MSVRLLLDEHYSQEIAERLRRHGHDVDTVVGDPQLRGLDDREVFAVAAEAGRRVVTENVKDFRPLLQRAYAESTPVAQLLLVPPGKFPRARGRRTTAIVDALSTWLTAPDVDTRPDEDWLV